MSQDNTDGNMNGGASSEQYEDPDIIYDDPDIIHEWKNYVRLDPEESTAIAKEQLDLLENVSLNIAVTGESGAGKSTFVNALRGLGDEDEEAAKTGVTETTMKAIRYPHPTMPNVFIWDLPGIGTPNFTAKKYRKEVKLDTYDFFIIIGTVRFTENIMNLAKEVKKMKKTFYFVRSQIDNDIRAEKKKKNFNEEKVLSVIRSSCEQNMKPVGSKVFLISAKELGKYDFQAMVHSLQDNLPDHKRSALIQSLPVCSMEMIETKKKELFKMSSSSAAAAASSCGIPIPGLSVGCEIAVILSFLQKAYIAFGLDEKSIQSLSERFNKPEDQLRAVMTSRFTGGINEGVVAKMLNSRGMIAAKTAEVLLSITVAGSPGAMGIAFATTLNIMRKGVKEMAEDAKAVLVLVGL